MEEEMSHTRHMIPGIGHISVFERPFLPKGTAIKFHDILYVDCIYPVIFMDGVTSESMDCAISFAKAKIRKFIESR